MANQYVVVGGSSGIGLSLTMQLVNDGHQVYVISRTTGRLTAHPNLTHLACNVLEDPIPIDLLPDAIHGLAYCPGSINLKPFRGLKPEQFLADFNINVIGAVKVLQALQKPLKKAGESSIVFFSTVAVQQGMPFHASIAAAKGAIEGITRSLAAEWAPKIRVNCIAPSLTDTPMASRLLSSDDKREASANRHPLKKVGSPEDVAAFAKILLSQTSSWVTGQVFGIDGGLSSVRV